MLQDIFISLTTLALLGVLMLPRVRDARAWRATVTPLASIIGSGFLVIGPILDDAYGAWAPLAMAALCAAAWAFGAAIRENISTIDGAGPRSALETRLETAASWALAFAYVISVAYYLNLFGAFGVSLTALDDPFHARALTSAIFVIVLAIGWSRGFSALERLEQVTVSIKLATIAGLVAGLVLYFGDKATSHELMLNPARLHGWDALALLFGLIVTVQGFETARYLGDSYDADTRRRAMRLAQGVSSAIYVIYILLIAYVFAPEHLPLHETAIIDMMERVAPVLPLLLIAAALSAQLSAAVADAGGSGGLVHELSRGRISHRQAYAILTAAGLALTWTADVFTIISYASRAFALYYALQAAIAAAAAARAGPAQRGKAVAFGLLAVLGGVIVVFGAEASV